MKKAFLTSKRTSLSLLAAIVISIRKYTVIDVRRLNPLIQQVVYDNLHKYTENTAKTIIIKISSLTIGKKIANNKQ